MSDPMRIFSAVGPLGAGKTTLTILTIEEMIRVKMTSKEKCAYVINDEGANVDGSLISRCAKVLPMTSGCFTCQDEDELRKTLHELAGQKMEWVFLEGFGMTSGNETKKFLKSVPYQFSIVCVLDHHNHDRNLVRYADVVKSQVHSATIGTAITKYGNAKNLKELPDTGILDFVARNSHGKPAFLIPEGSPLPLQLLTAIFAKQSPALLPVAQQHDCSHHGHGHAHHHHVHSMYAYSYDLRKDAKFNDVVGVFNGCPESIWRIKGAVEGKLFNGVFDDWRQTTEDKRTFVTFYSQREISLGVDLPSLAKLIVPDTQVLDDEQSYEMLRKEGVSDEDTIAEIERLIAEVPRKALLQRSSGGFMRLITHPEILQILKEISRRPRVKEIWFPKALKRCLEYWVACGKVLRSPGNNILAPTIPANQRELGVSMAWWATHYGNHFDSELLSVIKALRIGEMMAEGALVLASLNSDPEKAYWQCQEFLCSAKFGLANKENRSLINQAMQHCLSLSQGTAVHEEWQKACAQLG